jgi:DNA (cytosine-5)-methyltransferase 1
MHRYPYQWTLENANFTKDKGKVFSCFACGGGSTMGYKLAGFDVIGCNEIDPRMNKVYVANHHPQYNYVEGIQTFKLRKDLPDELYRLDILDGSPPCSTFSMAGNREDDWGKTKTFREGQAEQVLDTLFFDFIDLAKELQPKVVIAENVKGLLLGEAFSYVRRIYEAFDEAGFEVCHTLCDASTMGVPQRRERVFFTAIRKDLFQYIPQRHDLFYSYPVIDLTFNEEPITARMLDLELDVPQTAPLRCKDYETMKAGGSVIMASLFGLDDVVPTITAELHKNGRCAMPNWKLGRYSRNDICKIQTFPMDYDFGAKMQYFYIAGMSVPPVMMAQVASRVYEQWLSKLPKEK